MLGTFYGYYERTGIQGGNRTTLVDISVNMMFTKHRSVGMLGGRRNPGFCNIRTIGKTIYAGYFEQEKFANRLYSLQQIDFAVSSPIAMLYDLNPHDFIFDLPIVIFIIRFRHLR